MFEFPSCTIPKDKCRKLTLLQITHDFKFELKERDCEGNLLLVQPITFKDVATDLTRICGPEEVPATCANFEVNIETDHPTSNSSDGEIRLSASNDPEGYYSYHKTDANGENATDVPGGVLKNLNAGEYYFQVRDNLHCCLKFIPVTLIDCGVIETNIDATFFPEDQNALLTAVVSGGEQPYSYKWSNGEQSQLTYVDQSGIHGVTVTDFFGCQLENFFEITCDEVNFYNTDVSNYSCDNFSIAVDFDNPQSSRGYSCKWTNDFNFPLISGSCFDNYSDITDLGEGNYNLEISDGICSSDYDVQVYAPYCEMELELFDQGGGNLFLEVLGGGLSGYDIYWEQFNCEDPPLLVKSENGIDQFEFQMIGESAQIELFVIDLCAESGCSDKLETYFINCDGFQGGSENQGISEGKVSQYSKDWPTELTAYPNPIISEIKLSYTLSTKQQLTAKVYDSLGRILINKKINGFQGRNRISIPISNKFSNGIYLLELSNEEGEVLTTSKLIK